MQLLSLVLAVLALEVNRKVYGDEEKEGHEKDGMHWFPKLHCRQDYKAEPFERGDALLPGGNYFKNLSDPCGEHEKDESCLKFCVLEKMSLIEEKEVGVKLKNVEHILSEVYSHERNYKGLADHIIEQCEDLISSDFDWNCYDLVNAEGLACIESYLNCSKGLRDFWPLRLYDLRCHVGQYGSKHISPRVRKNVGSCLFEYKDSDLCALGCIMEREGYGKIMNRYVTTSYEEAKLRAVVDLAGKLGEAGLKPLVSDVPSDYQIGLAKKILKNCSPHYDKSFMDGWFQRRREDSAFASSKDCDANFGKWFKYLVCVEDVWTNNGGCKSRKGH